MKFNNDPKAKTMTKAILMLLTSMCMFSSIVFGNVVFDSVNPANAQSKAEQQAKILHTYKCNDGSSFRARFDNTGNFSIAVLDLGQTFEIPLIETVSGSGESYSNEDYTLQTKGMDAVLTHQGNITVCAAAP